MAGPQFSFNFTKRFDWRGGKTVQQAFYLNNPLSFAKGLAIWNNFSLLNISVMIDVVKKAEDEDILIVRLHEFAGGQEDIELSVSASVEWWGECDLMENMIEEKNVTRK